MVRQKHQVAVRGQSYERHAHQGRTGQVEGAYPVLGHQRGDARPLLAGGEGAEVDLLPGQGDALGHGLHQAPGPEPDESGTEVGVAVQQCRARGTQHGRGQLAGEFQGALGVVDVDAVLGEHRVEVHALLERGQRQYVGEAGAEPVEFGALVPVGVNSGPS